MHAKKNNHFLWSPSVQQIDKIAVLLLQFSHARFFSRVLGIVVKAHMASARQVVEIV